MTTFIHSMTADFPKLPLFNIDTFIQNKITDFYFHFHRKNNTPENITKFSFQYNELLKKIIHEMKTTVDIHQKKKYKEYLCILYKLIGQTRDIVHGKGERDFTYMMIHSWYSYYPVLSMFALRLLTQNQNQYNTELQDLSPALFSSYGSWADIKYFCHYVLHHEPNIIQRNQIIDTAIGIMNHQLHNDLETWNTTLSCYLYEKKENPYSLTPKPNARDLISFVSKWIPRENSKYHWLYTKMVIQWNTFYSPQMLETAKTEKQYLQSISKCKRNYRKMVSYLNRELDTVQIKQCSQQWSKIIPENVSITTIHQQKNAFFNNNRLYSSEKTNNPDRIQCATHFQEFFTNIQENTSPSSFSVGNIQRKHTMSLGEYIKQGFELLSLVNSNPNDNNLHLQLHWLNHLWKQMICKKNVRIVPNFIPIIDISWQYPIDDVYSGVGIGILLSQLSSVSRIMLSGSQPEWIQLSMDDLFTDILKKIHPHVLHSTHSFLDKTFDIICESILCSHHSKEELSIENTQKYTFVILSGSHSSYISNDLSKTFQQKIDCIPSIIYWNFSSNILDNPIHDFENITFISGDNHTFIDYIIQFGIDSIQNHQPYHYICELLLHPRYTPLNNYFHEFI